MANDSVWSRGYNFLAGFYLNGARGKAVGFQYPHDKKNPAQNECRKKQFQPGWHDAQRGSRPAKRVIEARQQKCNQEQRLPQLDEQLLFADFLIALQPASMSGGSCL
jgi:hypothetical protein